MRRARLILLLLAFRGMPACAQVQATLDVGASHVNEAGVSSASGLSAGGTLDAVAARGWLRVSALGVTGSGLQSSAQGLAAGSFDLRESGLVRPFAAATSGFFTQRTLGHSTSAELAGGARLVGAARGASIAGSVGVLTIDGGTRSVYRGVADSWISAAAERFSGEVALTSSEARFVGGVPDSTAGGLQHYIDVIGAWRHELGGFSLGVTGGVRHGGAAAPGGGWGSADAALWVAPRAAVALTVGSSLEDVVRGIPRTTYVTAAVRFVSQPHAAVFGQTTVAGPHMLARSVGDARRIEVFGVAASRVEVMGDFTQWQPVALERVGTIWRLEQRIVPGPHRVAVRIDGGAWRVPVNLPGVEDDLGGVVGVITIP